MPRSATSLRRLAALCLATLSLGSTVPATAQTCTPDVNGDGVVDSADLGVLLSAWGSTYPATIDGVSPNQGPPGGGTVITITGSALASTSQVLVGGAPCTDVTVVSATEVRATTPAGAPGPASVSVTTLAGTTTLKGAFSYGAFTTPSWATLIEAMPDPSVVTSPALRNAIIATGYAWRVRDNVTQIEMLLVPPGTFNMGCSASILFDCREDEFPVHAVTLPNAFYIGRYEVTQAQWTATMGSNPSNFQSASAQVPATQVSSRPVERVSWNMIQGFLSLSGMRLPTEAEWEYACRAGTTTAFHSMPGFPNGTNNDDHLDLVAWGPWNSVGQTRVVGGKAANALGLHDMLGNVWELLSDYYGHDYYSASPAVNPQGPGTGTSRIIRGEGWSNYFDDDFRVSNRASAPPDVLSDDIGFRVVRNP
jgi:formylglycine-generating enzyme required for sulfatase activity